MITFVFIVLSVVDLRTSKDWMTVNTEMEIIRKVGGRVVVQWLRHYATNRQVAGSIPDGIIGIFQ